MKNKINFWSFLSVYFLEWEIFQENLQRKLDRIFCAQ